MKKQHKVIETIVGFQYPAWRQVIDLIAIYDSIGMYARSEILDQDGQWKKCGARLYGYYHDGLFEFHNCLQMTGSKKYPASIKKINWTDGTWTTLNLSRKGRTTKLSIKLGVWKFLIAARKYEDQLFIEKHLLTQSK